MQLDEYQAQAVRTGSHYSCTDMSLSILALGLAGEAGEVADHIKKVIGHGHSLDSKKIVKELGDVMWYVAMLAHVLKTCLSDVAQVNIDKLKERYPDGFSSVRSINRKA